jgi:hypothetical protein
MTDTATVEPTASGLLDNVQVEDNTQASNPQAAEIDHKAATPGGDVPGTPKTKPEYLPDNFWDAEKGEAKYEAMAKSWSDLRKTISQGKHKAPEDGKYDAKVFGEDAENNPIAGTLTEWAKENGLSQAQFDDLATKLREKSQEIMGDVTIDPAAELKALGPNANAIVDGMANWARGLVNKGVLSKDDFEEFKIMGGTARGINVLLKIREAYEGRVPIEAAHMDGAPSKEELYQMVADPKYKTDAAYRQKVERLFQANLG